MRGIRKFLALSVLLSLIFYSAAAWAAVNVQVGVAAQDSTIGNIIPDRNGSAAQYQYTVNDGSSIADTIPVEICPSRGLVSGESFKVSFGSPAGNLNGVTVPADVSFSSANAAQYPACQTVNIQLNTGALTLSDPSVGKNFNANINLSTKDEAPTSGSNRLHVSLDGSKVIHIKVAVMPAAGNVSCFLTDSEGLFLSDCTGQFVTDSGSDDGRFKIIANKKLIEVATNPGQFYYNFVWRNTTGQPQTVSVDFDRKNNAGVDSVLPKGAQALHAAVFNGYLQSIAQNYFDDANSIGLPEGTDDQVSNISVPAGSSLLVTYHLEWAGLGKPVPSVCAEICDNADQQIKIMGTISGTDIGTESCTAEAFGYKK